MIVAIGSLQREATGIIRSGDYIPVVAPEDFVAYRPESENFPAIVLSGSGTARAARATKWAIEEFSPEAIISFGFCGATQENTHSGDIVIAARVLNLPGTPFEWSIVDDTNSLGPNRTMLLAARTAVEVAGLDYHHGTIVTVSQKAVTGGSKRWLGEAINATGVDLGTHAIAAAATDAGIPWAAALSVLDDRDFDAPAIVDRLGYGPNERGITAYIKHITNNPLDFPDLVRLGRASTRAGASLIIFMAAFMEAHSTLAKIEQPAESE